jgi:hypothetical protein
VRAHPPLLVTAGHKYPKPEPGHPWCPAVAAHRSTRGPRRSPSVPAGVASHSIPSPLMVPEVGTLFGMAATAPDDPTRRWPLRSTSGAAPPKTHRLRPCAVDGRR